MSGIVQNVKNSLRGALKHFMGEGLDHLENPIESAGLRAVCYEDFPADPAFLRAWDALSAAAPFSSAFQTPAWQQAVFATLCKPGRLRLLAVYRNPDQLAAVLPMSIRDDGLLESLGPAVSDYLDPLVDPAIEPEVCTILLKLLARLREGKRRNVTLHCIRDTSPLRRILPDLAKAEGFEYAEQITEHTPVLALPKTWDDYLATLDAHERKETRRKLNKAQTKANARLVRCSADPAEIEKTLAHTFALMEQAPGEKGEAIKGTVRPLLAKAAPPMIASGRLWLTTLYLNDEPSAVTIQFPHADGPMLYNCGFDVAKKEWSPGVVLTSMIIQQAIESGAGTFDLLRGEEPYKYKLGATNRPLWMLSLKKL